MKNNYNYLFVCQLGDNTPKHFIQKRNIDTNNHFISTYTTDKKKESSKFTQHRYNHSNKRKIN